MGGVKEVRRPGGEAVVWVTGSKAPIVGWAQGEMEVVRVGLRRVGREFERC